MESPGIEEISCATVVTLNKKEISKNKREKEKILEMPTCAVVVVQIRMAIEKSWCGAAAGMREGAN